MKAVPPVAGREYVDSSTEALIVESLSGGSQIGEIEDCTAMPPAFLSWNFTGMVLPRLKTLEVCSG